MTLLERLQKHLTKSGDCWLWTGSVKANGYGAIGVKLSDGTWKIRRAHRVAWELFRGRIPAGLCVCHSCDRPACCNPDHLFLGTAEENWRDSHQKGRSRQARGYPAVRGERNGQSKLTEETVRVMRDLYRSGAVYQRELAAMFGISQATTCLMLRGDYWAHVA